MNLLSSPTTQSEANRQQSLKNFLPLSSSKTWEKRKPVSPSQWGNIWGSSLPFKWGFSGSCSKIKGMRLNTESGNFHFQSPNASSFTVESLLLSHFVWLRHLGLIASGARGRGQVSESSTNCSNFHGADDKHFHPPLLPAQFFGAKGGGNASSCHSLQTVSMHLNRLNRGNFSWSEI